MRGMHYVWKLLNFAVIWHSQACCWLSTRPGWCEYIICTKIVMKTGTFLLTQFPENNNGFCFIVNVLFSVFTVICYCMCVYLLTYSMVQSPWEANWFAASQEIPHISRNPKVHYRTYKRLPPVSILGQPNPVHIPTSHLVEIHPNIIHPSMPRSPQWSLSLRFPQQDPIHPPLLTHMRHMPSPSHSSRFYHPHNIGWGVQII